MSQPQDDVSKAKTTALFSPPAHTNPLSLHAAGQDLLPHVHPKNAEDFQLSQEASDSFVVYARTVCSF